jgi:hypothetical protein
MSIRIERAMTVMLLLSATAYSADNAGDQSASAALGSTWADAAKMPDMFTGMWMVKTGGMVESNEKLNVPYTAQAQKYVDAYKYVRDIPYAQDGCLSPGLPIAMRSGPIKFTYAPGLIAIYMQSIGHTRFIRMNQEMGKTSPKYYGNSVGRWEGDTLVVETADFVNEISFQYGVGKGMPPAETFGPGAPGGPPSGLNLSKAIWGPHGEGMRMVERFRLADPDTLELNLTIYDDTVWTKPFITATRNFRHIQKGISDKGIFSGEPEEWVCTVSITSFDPETNTYVDKDPEEMVEFLNKLGR